MPFVKMNAFARSTPPRGGSGGNALHPGPSKIRN
jgi:hypothetical protein